MNSSAEGLKGHGGEGLEKGPKQILTQKPTDLFDALAEFERMINLFTGKVNRLIGFPCKLVQQPMCRGLNGSAQYIFVLEAPDPVMAQKAYMALGSNSDYLMKTTYHIGSVQFELTLEGRALNYFLEEFDISTATDLSGSSASIEPIVDGIHQSASTAASAAGPEQLAATNSA